MLILQDHHHLRSRSLILFWNGMIIEKDEENDLKEFKK